MIKSERARGARTEEASIVVASQTSAHGGKAAFSCVVPERSRALRESAGPAAKRKKLSTSRRKREIQGRVSAPFRSLARSLAENRSAAPGGGVGVGVGILVLFLSLPFALARDSPATGMPNSGPSSISFQAHFRLVP